jgi:hypothetical protein
MHRYDPSWPTNYHDWYHDIGAADHNVALWATFHERYYNDLHELESMPWWHKVDKILILGQEATHTDWVHQDPRIWVWDSRYLPDLPRFHSFFWWWRQTLEVEHHQKSLQKLIDPRITAPRWHFDCQLGSRRQHRDFLVQAIQSSPVLQQCCFVTGTKQLWTPGTDLEKTLRPNGIDRGTNNMLPYHGTDATTNVSTFLPYLIYNQSWFSVITETNVDYNFFTEKTAKALLAQRMFVVLGAPNLLSELRAMGFETFGDVLDESYDTVCDNTTRWSLAIDQITHICKQDPLLLYQKILPVLQHNQQHLLKQDMIKQAQQQMISVCNHK